MQLVEIGKIKKRLSKLRSLQINCFTQLITVIIVLSPLLNTFAQDSVIYKYTYYFIAFICSCFCLNSLNRSLFVTVGFFCFGFLIFFDLRHALSLALGTICALSVFRNKEKFSDVILYITYFHCALSIAQLLGVHEYVYLLADGKNPPSVYEQWSLFENVQTTFLPQIRPPGLFPSPTYSSFFLCAILLLICIKKNFSHLSLIVIGLLLSVSGSTFSCLIVLVLVILLVNIPQGKTIIISYLVGMSLYFANLPDVFSYNFNTQDLFNSVSSRLAPEDNMSESVFFQSISESIFVICAFMILIFLSLKQVTRKSYIILPAILILFPALVHNLSSSVVYLFLSALSINFAYDAYAKNKKRFNKYTEHS